MILASLAKVIRWKCNRNRKRTMMISKRMFTSLLFRLNFEYTFSKPERKIGIVSCVKIDWNNRIVIGIYYYPMEYRWNGNVPNLWSKFIVPTDCREWTHPLWQMSRGLLPANRKISSLRLCKYRLQDYR